MNINDENIIGYKAMNRDHTNRYGFPFEEGKIYEVEGQVKFGNAGNGFHMCLNIEDTFRFFDTTNGNISIAIVEGSGKRVVYNDEYYGYYDMYSFEIIKILKFLTREEIIEVIVNKNNEESLKRFISTFKMTQEEIEYFAEIYKDNLSILKFLLYYQLGAKQVFDNKEQKNILEIKERVLNGQNNSKGRKRK